MRDEKLHTSGDIEVTSMTSSSVKAPNFAIWAIS